MEGVVLKKATPTDKSFVPFLVQMINDVYRVSEAELWKDAHERTNPSRLNEVIDLGELLLAVQGESILGCIHLEPMEGKHFKFKMLVANPQVKGKGIGSLLVKFAEQEAQSKGGDTMQLELLVPTGIEHADKVFLHNWYSRIGYTQTAEHDVDYVHQGLSQLLKTGCVAKIYQKKLIPAK